MLEIKYKYRKKRDCHFLKATYESNFNFTLNGENTSIDSFKYPGVFCNYNCSFARHKTHLVEQSRKAIHVCITDEIKKA